MNIKTLFNTDDERAVSPVIGVILMVAITVILAAVIGAFVLDLGQGQDSNVNAAVSNDGGTITLTDKGNADGVKFVTGGDTIGDGSAGVPDGTTVTLENVGDSVDLTGNSNGFSSGEVNVVAYQGDANSPDNENVIQTLNL